MTPAALVDGASDEAALQAFLATLPPEHATAVRTLAHAWQAAGGFLQVGRVTVRLCTKGRDGRFVTAGTLHAAKPPERGREPATGGPTFEIGRVLLNNHGVAEADWRGWSDDLADLQVRGFDAAAKYPCIALEELPSATLVRLAQAVRDLGRLAQGQPG